MERKGPSEKFQPIMVASFNRPQIESVATWLVLNSITNGRTFESALETVGLDEKGKVMDVKSKKRLRYGETINILYRKGVRINQIAGIIQVWQTTPDDNKLEFRYDTIQPRNFGLTRH